MCRKLDSRPLRFDAFEIAKIAIEHIFFLKRPKRRIVVLISYSSSLIIERYCKTETQLKIIVIFMEIQYIVYCLLESLHLAQVLLCTP
jgi:hypothetical protein